MILAQDDNFNDRKLKSLSGPYSEVMVAETNSKHTAPSSPMNTYSKYYSKTPTTPKRELPNETSGTLNRDSLSEDEFPQQNCVYKLFPLACNP